MFLFFANRNVSFCCFSGKLTATVPAWNSIINCSIALKFSFFSSINCFSKHLLLHFPFVIYFRCTTNQHSSMCFWVFLKLVQDIDKLMITLNNRHILQTIFNWHVRLSPFHKHILTYLLMNNMHIRIKKSSTKLTFLSMVGHYLRFICYIHYC